jgi:hypothetical protein
MSKVNLYDPLTNTFVVASSLLYPQDDTSNEQGGIVKNKKKQKKILEKIHEIKEFINYYKSREYTWLNGSDSGYGSNTAYDNDDKEIFEERKQRDIDRLCKKFTYYNNKLPSHVRISLEK